MSQFHDFARFEFSSLEDAPFSADAYSRLKFGCDRAARLFGHMIADAFFEQHASVLLTNPCLVIPSPYNYVPNAATIMTMHLLNRLNYHVVNANGHHVEYMTIPRKVSYVNDYGFLSKEHRKSLLDGDKFYINSKYVKGRTLIFVDDVKITGTHEDKLIELMQQQKLKNEAHFLYFAKYNGDQPDIESKINFAAVNSLKDLNRMVEEPNHHMIVRPIKYMLGSDREELFEDFLQFRTGDYLNKLYYNCLHEGYYRIPRYQENFKQIRQLIGQ